MEGRFTIGRVPSTHRAVPIRGKPHKAIANTVFEMDVLVEKKTGGAIAPPVLLI